MALYGQQGGAYSEARGAATLLGFERLNTGVGRRCCQFVP
jgi:hypothetical protein